MRRIRSVGIIAALTTVLAVVPTVSFGQSLKEADVLNNKVIELYNAGQYTQAISLAEKVLSIREKTLGPNHPNVASSLNTLANLYHRQNRYADAERLYRRSLAITEKALGSDHPHVATMVNNLASLYVNQGRYADAEPLIKRSLAIQKQTLGCRRFQASTDTE